MDIKSFAIGMIFGSEDSGGSQPTASPWTKLAEQDFTVSTTSTSATVVGTIAVGESGYTDQKMLYARVRDKAGKRDGYFYGADVFIPSTYMGTTGLQTRFPIFYCVNEGQGTKAKVIVNTSACGVYVSALNGSGSTFSLTISSKYNSSYGTIDGTYHVEVYTLAWPDNVSPFT